MAGFMSNRPRVRYYAVSKDGVYLGLDSVNKQWVLTTDESIVFKSSSRGNLEAILIEIGATGMEIRETK